MRLAVPKVSRRRTDQLRDLMAVLELGTINLDHAASISDHAFRCRFYQASFAGTGGAEEQEVADRPAGTVHPRQIRLVDVNDLIDRFILSDNPPLEVPVQFVGFPTRLPRIQFLI